MRIDNGSKTYFTLQSMLKHRKKREYSGLIDLASLRWWHFVRVDFHATYCGIQSFANDETRHNIEAGYLSTYRRARKVLAWPGDEPFWKPHNGGTPRWPVNKIELQHLTHCNVLLHTSWHWNGYVWAWISELACAMPRSLDTVLVKVFAIEPSQGRLLHWPCQ